MTQPRWPLTFKTFIHQYSKYAEGWLKLQPATMMQRVMSAMSTMLRSTDRATARLVGAPLPQWGTKEPFACLMPWDLTTKDSLEV